MTNKLPPGVYERDARGLLVPTRKILAPTPPKPITDIRKSTMESLYDDVVKHYEAKTGHSLTTSKRTLSKFRDMCDRAGNALFGRNK